jgi:integrase
MSRTASRLTAMQISRIRKKGRYADGGGLYLRVSPTLNKSWVFRWVRGRVENEMGLGRFPDVSLVEARRHVFHARQHLAAGRNPKSERNRTREHGRSFRDVAEEYLSAMQGRWTNEKTRWQWRHTLNVFAAPIHKLGISQVDTADVLPLLKPIWLAKPETAAKARMRLEAVLDYGKAKGWREGENPARWRGHLSNILPPRRLLSRGHHAAMPYREVPAFIDRLQGAHAMAARALEFLILTACRTQEVLGASWDEIDLSAALWVIPAHRMKTRREHRAPLSSAALELLQTLHEARISEFVFPGQVRGKPLSNLAMAMLMRRMKADSSTPHGFRSSFRDWAGDKTSFPREIAEAALAHKVGDSVELAYRRGDALEKRRGLMQAWAEYCEAKSGDNVFQLARQM